MATAGDGAAAYEGRGAGGKFRKRPFRRSTQATPYDRPPIAHKPSLFTKLVDPASRLLYAGAHRLFGAFRKHLPPLPPPRSTEAYEEPRNSFQEAGANNCNGVSIHSTDQGGDSATVAAATEISELEQMLKQKTFTRSEIERLTALLHSKTTESLADDDVGRDGAKVCSTSHMLRLEGSTSGTLEKHVVEKEKLYAAISTPVTGSRVLEDEIASPAELAKAYMGTWPTKVAPSPLGLSSQALRQDSSLLNNATVLPKTEIVTVAPKITNGFRGLENGFITPRARGRSAMYNMARTPYSRAPSTFSQKAIQSDYGHGAASPSLKLSHSTWGQEGSFGSNKMALKRRSSVLDDDMRSGGPLRRIRQKANHLSQGSILSKDKREVGSSDLQQPNAGSQKLLLMNEPEPKVSKEVEENGEPSMRNLGYASVPTRSAQMATKILQQLDRLGPKEKPSGSNLTGTREKTPTKLTSNMLHGQALRSLEKVDSQKFLRSPQDGQKSEDQHHSRLPDARESSSQGKDKVEENGPRKFAVPRNTSTLISSDSTVLLRENVSIDNTTDSTLKLPAELPQKKRAFQMSVDEDSFDLDDDIPSNGHVSIPLAENKKSDTSFVANKAVSIGAPPEVTKTPVPPEVTKTPASPEVTKTPASPGITSTPAPSKVTPALPEVSKPPAEPEFKKASDVVSPPKPGFGLFGSSVASEQKTGYNFPTSPLSSTDTQSVVVPQSTSQLNGVSPQESNAFPSFGTSAKSSEKVPPFLFSTNQHSESKTNASSDTKSPASTSAFNSAINNDQVKAPVASKDDNDIRQTSVNIFGKSESSPSAVGIFSFGASTVDSSVTNRTTASNPSIFSSSAPSTGTDTSKFFSNSPFHATSSGATSIASTITTTAATIPSSTAASSSVFSTPTPAPIFSFGSAITTTLASTPPPTSVAEAPVTKATYDKEPKSNNVSSSPFASASFPSANTRSSLFGFSSPATTSSFVNNQSQGSFFNVTSGSQAITQPSTTVTQAVPFQFGSSAPSLVPGTTGIPSSTAGGSLFGSSTPASSSAPSFALSSASMPSFGLSASAASEIKSVSSTSGSTASIFGSAWQAPKSSAFGATFSSPSTVFAFGASSASTPAVSSSPIMFGSANTGGSTGSSMFSFTSAGPTNRSFPAPSQSQSPFGNPTPVFGATTTSPNNNDQMSMEDSMAEDSMQTPTPAPAFGQAPAAAPRFMFGSATPAQTPPPATNPVQFGGQPSQAPSPNPFQASGSLEFNGGGGSFSLGTGGGDKSGRRILRVKNKSRRK